MKTYKHNGETMNHTPSGAAIASGELVEVGNIVGVSKGAYADGEEGVLQLEGVIEVKCKSTDVVAIGDLLYNDSVNKELTLTSTDNPLAGKAMSASPDGTTVVEVKLG